MKTKEVKRLVAQIGKDNLPDWLLSNILRLDREVSGLRQAVKKMQQEAEKA